MYQCQKLKDDSFLNFFESFFLLTSCWWKSFTADVILLDIMDIAIPSQNIQVAVRVRNVPTWKGRGKKSGTADSDGDEIVAFPGPKSSNGTSSSITIQDSGKEQKEFSYDSVFPPEDDQQVLYDKMVRPIVDCCLAGYNGCIFAYGQVFLL